MKAILCEHFGDPAGIVLKDIPDPAPGPDEVRLEVHYAGVNFPDTLITQGRYQIKPDLPFSPGSEAGGIVDAVGEGVSGIKVGDRVMAMEYHGAMAEYMIAKAANVTLLPDAMPLDVAAGFTTNYATSYHALKQRAQLKAGETVLVLGAGGGVGITAVELAKLMGAKVVAAASSQEKLDLCRSYGADDTINYAEEDLRAGIARTTDGRGPDVIYDPVGGALAEPAFRSIAWNGRYLIIGFAAGEIPRLPFNLPLLKGASIVGAICGIFATKEPQAYRRNLEELLGFYVEGKLQPHISKHFDLGQGSEAIQWIADRRATGKIVVKVN